MKKKNAAIPVIIILTVLVCFMLAGCDPVADTRRGIQPVGTDLNIPLTFSRHTNSVTVMFPQVKYVNIYEDKNGYGYTITEKVKSEASNPVPISSEALSYQNGLWFAEIPFERDLIPDTEYTVILYAKNSVCEWTEVGRDNVRTRTGDVNDEVIAFVSKRSSDSAVIEIADELNPGSMIYKVVGLDSGEKIYEQDAVENGKITIDGLDPEKEYSITIYQALSSAPDKFGTTPAEITIEKYNASLDSNIELSFTDGVFYADFSNETELIASIDKVSLIRLEEEASGKYSVEFTKAASEIDSSYKLSFDSEDFMKSLDFGIFSVVAYDEDSQSETKEAKMSNSVDASTGIIIKGIKEKRPQSVWLNIKEFADDVNTTEIKLYMDGSYSAELGDDNDSILLKGFTSKTKYEAGSIRLSVSYDGKTFITDVPEFTTGSFSGNYAWGTSNPPTDSSYASGFFVSVKNSSDVLSSGQSSDYSYYIYTDLNDEFYKRSGIDAGFRGRVLRIMPLIDTKTDPEVADIPSKGFSYPDDISSANYYQKAYAWNNKKWNKSPMNPDKVTSITDTVSRDSYFSVVVSNALSLVDVTTETRFEFYDDGYSSYLIFRNEITKTSAMDSYIKGQLMVNPSPNQEIGDKSKYTFVLVRQGEN